MPKILTTPFCLQLDEQAEAIELANSVLIEVTFFAFFTFVHSTAKLLLLQISKASVKNWQSKLQTRYGWFKTENCKNIIFDVSILTSEFSFRDPTTDIDSLKAIYISCDSIAGALQAVHGSEQEHGEHHSGALRGSTRRHPKDPHPELKVHGMDCRAGDACSHAR